ncbi:MAG: metallophosphoesterase [Bacteroidales bacterium]|nr:metallophosphoesterase [Bacteroidales bacterium]
MRFPLLPIIIILIVNAAIDLYIYCALHSYCRKRLWPRIQAWSAVACAAALIVAICLPKRGGSDDCLRAAMWILYAYFSVYVPKILFLVGDVCSRIPCIWDKHRWQWMSWVGFGVGCVFFLAMWWGALVNRFSIDVNEVDIEVAGLPRGFDGFTIAQISDLHVGTYGNDPDFLEDLVAGVNALNPDMIVFTGDIVNRHSQELIPFVDVLSELKAPCGVYSIMGNHDYGDYCDWDTPEQKQADIRALQKMQAQMGWQMLNNAHDWIHWRGDSIVLIGVENVGDPPFHTYGDLKIAYPTIGDRHTKILLSHNPAHWDLDIQDNRGSNIALTLSGHTHAMQMELFGWSPSMWRYEHWGGLYADDHGQKLYVNIGAGEVAFPARIGATPEITLFTLKSSQK